MYLAQATSSLLKLQQFFAIIGSLPLTTVLWICFAILWIDLSFFRQNRNSKFNKRLYSGEGSFLMLFTKTTPNGTGIINENRILDMGFPFSLVMTMFVRCWVAKDDIGAK
jgi:hypothetical protein